MEGLGLLWLGYELRSTVPAPGSVQAGRRDKHLLGKYVVTTCGEDTQKVTISVPEQAAVGGRAAGGVEEGSAGLTSEGWEEKAPHPTGSVRREGAWRGLRAGVSHLLDPEGSGATCMGRRASVLPGTVRNLDFI